MTAAWTTAADKEVFLPSFFGICHMYQSSFMASFEHIKSLINIDLLKWIGSLLKQFIYCIV